MEFLHKQIQTESEADWYSAPFSLKLLLGMYCTPILAVPRKGQLYLCNHHSHREFVLNSMIKQDDIAGVKLDGIHELGESLHLFRCQHSGESLVIFKSDVKATYRHRQIPLHYLWQIKQVIFLRVCIAWTVLLVSGVEDLSSYLWCSGALSHGSPSMFTRSLISRIMLTTFSPLN